LPGKLEPTTLPRRLPPPLHVVPIRVQWPAVRKWSTPPRLTLKPSEQREPPVVIAWPPEM
jgi:hypothetical protein